MPNLTTATQILLPPEGMQLTPAAVALAQSTVDNEVGQLVSAIVGTYNALPSVNPVTLTPTSGMNLQAGGSNQVVFAQGIILDTCPATTLTLAAGGGADRIDLIAIKASRPTGSSTFTANVRSDSATPQLVPVTATLVAGAVTVTLPATYVTPPVITGITPVGVDGTAGIRLVSAPTTTQAIFQSDDSGDTRTFSFLVCGNPVGSTGVSTANPLNVNSPVWSYVQNTSGSPLVAPSPPSGYDSFATVYVHASETTIAAADITYLFPSFASIPLNSQGVNNSTNLLGGEKDQWGTQAGVAANGTTTFITFTTPFAIATDNVMAIINTGSAASGTDLSIQKFAPTRFGFNVHISGGAPTDTVSVDYRAVGH